ncbi:MAG: hypothetical protein KF833_20600 [Verrucomicrobiae bacterium]|nr:hypothetical protein [Verrucomicrobiae bacterium]
MNNPVTRARWLVLGLVPAVFGVLSLPAASPPPDPALAADCAALRAVGPEGLGNAAATAAWNRLAARDAAVLPALLAAMNGAGERANNYFLAAASTIADRTLSSGGTLPLADVGAFLLDSTHEPRPRRLAYELVLRVDPGLASELRGGFIDDPAPELRREAVQHAIDTAAAALAGGHHPTATVLYLQALQFAREADQIQSVVAPLRNLGHSVDLVRQLGFLTRWHIIGPFDNTGGAGYERVLPPETEWNPRAEYPGLEGPVRWREFVSTNAFGKIDFNRALAPLKEVAGYAFTTFHGDADRPAEVRIGSKNGWKVWFNGEFLFGRDEYHRAAEIDQYRLPVRLRSGPNTILVKLTQNEMVEDWTVEWEFQLRVTDPAGRVLRSEPPAILTRHE